jgi:hypothetical protein
MAAADGSMASADGSMAAVKNPIVPKAQAAQASASKQAATALIVSKTVFDGATGAMARVLIGPLYIACSVEHTEQATRGARARGRSRRP